MTKSATDIVQDIINAAVIDAIVAVKDASRGLPNALLRDLNAIHANTANADLPPAIRTAITASVRDAFARLRKGGYVIAEANSVSAPPRRPDTRRPDSGDRSKPADHVRRNAPNDKRPRSTGRPPGKPGAPGRSPPKNRG